MAFSQEKLSAIFDRTEGRCHICRGNLAFSNYGAFGKRGAWEVEHSVAKKNGGTDRLNNLFAAHISCNRSKGTRSSKAARSQHGFVSAPHSKEKRVKNAVSGAGLGALVGVLVPPQFRLAAAAVGAIAGAIIGHESESK